MYGNGHLVYWKHDGITLVIGETINEIEHITISKKQVFTVKQCSLAGDDILVEVNELPGHFHERCFGDYYELPFELMKEYILYLFQPN